MDAWILMIEALAVYSLVLGAHSLRRRFSLAHYYALIGGLTAIMSWITDAGAKVEVGSITFLVGSTVFYTALLLGVFVVYVFDGPRATRITISTVVGVSVLVPIIALILHLQLRLSSATPLGHVPMPSLRINTASVLTTIMDLVFLAVAWEFMHKKLGRVPMGIRVFITLLGVLWLDVLLFNTGAFAGHSEYLSIMGGALASRFFVCLFAAPVLWAYMAWQSRVKGVEMPQRPLLAILKELRQVSEELNVARAEIQRRKQAEEALKRSEMRYRQLIQNASEAILLLQNGLAVLYNARARDVLGVDDKAMRMRVFSDFVHPDDRELVQDISSDQPRVVEFRGARHDDSPQWFQANMVMMDWKGGPACLIFLEDVTERKKQEQALQVLATVDHLTGIPNRRHFLELLEREMGRGRRYHQPVSLLMMDLDHFKSVNDTYGHCVGDEALKHVVAVCRKELRMADTMGRVGGEEFAVLLPQTDLRRSLEVAERIRAAVQESSFAVQGDILPITLSVGAAEADNNMSVTELLDAADQALLAAKRQGRNRVCAMDSPLDIACSDSS